MNLTTINREVLDYRSKQIQIVPGLFYNQYETLLNNYFSYNSKFRTGQIDEEGDRKYYYNVNKNPCLVYTKAIDFDTKNIKLLTVEGGDSLKTWFMERDLKYWMRDKQFGKVLNRIFKELPIHGSVVLKIVNGEPYFVDLRNFIVDQQADTIDDMNYKTEIHNYTVSGFRKVATQMKWEQSKVDDVIAEFHKMKDTSHIRLYERYGEVTDYDAGGKATYTDKRVFMADVGVDEYDMYGNLIATHPGIELSADVWDGHPYWEFHADKIPGRWLGVGVVETLMEPQIRQNEIANLQTKSSYWAALRIFQTRDGAINRNLMTDVRNGEIMNADSEITQIDMSDRNLAFFNEETDKWKNNTEDLTFSYGIVEGKGVSGGRSGNASVIASTMANAYFGQIQENIALDVKELLYSVIIPQFQKDNTNLHTVRIIGQDLDTYIAMVKNDLVTKEVIRLITTTNTFPTNHDRDVIGIGVEQSIKQGREKIIDIPKNFYSDLKFDVDIDITQESVDTQQRYATKFAILQAITADPTMLTDPTKRKILYGMAEDGGVNPDDFFGIDQTKTADGLAGSVIPGSQVPQAPDALLPKNRAGGGVSRPTFGAAIPGKATRTL